MTETAQGAERRITLRLLAYWEKLRGDRLMPREQDIVQADIADLWDHCFIMQVEDMNKSNYRYSYLGEGIRQAYRFELSEDEPGGMLSLDAAKLAAGYRQVAAQRKPLIENGDFRNLNSDIVRYRQCMLPLGEGEKVLAVFGGMRFKIFSS